MINNTVLPSSVTLKEGIKATFVSTITGRILGTTWTARYLWERQLPGSSSWTIVRDITKDTRNLNPKDYAGKRASLTDTFITSKSTLAKSGRKFRCRLELTTYYTEQSTGISYVYNWTSTSSEVTWLVENNVKLFDTDSFSSVPRLNKNGVPIGTGVPAPYLTPLVNACNRWSKFLRMNNSVIASIRSELGSNWKGITINAIYIDNLQGTDLHGAIAACGISAHKQLSSSAPYLRWNTTSIDLYINTHYQNDYTQAEWEGVMLHELGHGLGIGFYWDPEYTDTNTVNTEPYIKIGAYEWYDASSLNTDYYPGMGSIYESAGRISYDPAYSLRPVPLQTVIGAHWSWYSFPIQYSKPCECKYPWRPGACSDIPADGMCPKSQILPGIGNDLMVPYFDPDIQQVITPLSIKMLTHFGYEEIIPGASESPLTTTYRYPENGFVIQNTKHNMYTCDHISKSKNKKKS
jgi:hypothetical protein